MYGKEFVRPMDVGGTDQSHHAKILVGLCERGLVETKKIHAIYCPNGATARLGKNNEITYGHKPYEGCICKGHRRYRITAAGEAFVNSGTASAIRRRRTRV